MSNKSDKDHDWLSDNEIGEHEIDRFVSTGGKPELNSATPPADESQLVSVMLESIPTEVPLICPVYIKVGGKIVTLRTQNERFTLKRIAELRGKAVSSLYIHKDVWRLFLDALEKNEIKEGKDGLGVALYTRQLLIALGAELEKKFKTSKKPFFDQLQMIAEKLAIRVHANPAVGSSLLIKPVDESKYFISHCINAALYSAVIAHKLGLDIAETKLLTYAVLVHDIGKLMLPKTLWKKPGPLTAPEREMVQTHARLGAEYLQSVGAPSQVVQTALQHHERVDGKGYPGNLSPMKVHQFAKICAVADAFDTLTTDLSYRKAVLPGEAIKILRSSDGHFNPHILGTMAD